MKQFSYVVKIKSGIHARPAALLADRAKFAGAEAVTVECNGKTADGTKVMDIMNLKAKKDDTVIVTVEGGEEETIAEMLENLFRENF